MWDILELSFPALLHGWPWLGIGFCLPITHSTGGTTHNSSLLSPAEVWGGGRSSQLINPQLSNKSHVDTSSVINNLYVKLDVYFTLITIIHSVWQLHGSSQGDTESQGAARRVFCNNNLPISGLLTVNTQELTARGSTVSISKSLQSVEILPLLSWPSAAVWGMLTLPEVSVQCSRSAAALAQCATLTSHKPGKNKPAASQHSGLLWFLSSTLPTHAGSPNIIAELFCVSLSRLEDSLVCHSQFWM